MRSLPVIALFLSAGAAAAQVPPPNSAAPPLGTGQSNEIVNPVGNASSSVNASGTIRTVPMSDLAEGANSFTQDQARARIEGAGFRNVTGLAQGPDGVWRGHGDREGRTFDVGFDFKGQLAFR